MGGSPPSGDQKWEQVDSTSFVDPLDIWGNNHDGQWDGAPNNPPNSREGGPWTSGGDYAYFLGLGTGTVNISTPGGGNFMAPQGTFVNSIVGENYTFTGDRIEGGNQAAPTPDWGFFNKGGASTVTLQMDFQNIYTGGTFVYGGTLILDGQDASGQTLLDTGAVTVSGGLTDWGDAADYGFLGGQSARVTNYDLSGTLDINGNDEIVGLVVLDNNGQIIDSVGTGSLTGNNGASGLAYDVRDGTISAVLAGAGSLEKNTWTSVGPAGSGEGTSDGLDNTVILSGANTYTGTTTIADGILRADIADAAGAGALGNSTVAADITFTGGTLQYTSNTNDIAESNYDDRIQNSTAAISIDTNSTNVVYDSDLNTNTGGLTKYGAGTLTLSANNNAYTGDTTVVGGTLALDNGGANANSITGSALIEVQDPATLDVAGLAGGVLELQSIQTIRGGGSIVGGLTAVNGSSVTVGDGAPNGLGELNVSGNFSLNAGASLNLQINDAFVGAGPSAPGDYDQLSVAGDVTLGGALNITEFNTTDAFDPDFAEVFTIVDNTGTSSLTGTFSNWVAGDSVTIDSHVLKLYYNADGDSGNANDVVLVNASGPIDPTIGLFVDDQFTAAAQVDGNQERAGSQTAFVGVNAFSTTNAAFGSLVPSDYPATGNKYRGILTLNGNTPGNAYAVDLDHTNAENITLNLVADLNEGAGVDDVTISALNGSTGDSVVLRSETGSTRGNLIVQSGTFGGAITQNNAGGTLTKTGGAADTLVLTGDSNYTGATTINGGTLQLGNGGTGGSLDAGSSITIASGATFTVNQSDIVTQGSQFSSTAITGDGGITQAGAGTTVLNNSGNAYTGPTIIGGGTLQAAAGDGVGTGALGNGGGITFSGGGGTLQYTAASAGTDYSSRFSSSSAVIRIDTNGQNVTYASGISSDNLGGVTKVGSGTLTLSGTGTYKGDTNVNAGTLNFSGATIGTTNGDLVSVASGATLSGTGTINESLQILNGGNFDIGSFANDFTVNGAVDLQGGSTSFFEIQGLGASNIEQLLGVGAFTANGTIDVDLSGYAPSLNETFDLVDFTSFLGTPSFDFADAGLAVGLQWNTDNFSTDGTIFVELAKNYWDDNGATTGTGNTGGNWTDAKWSLDSTGESATGNWDNAGGGGSAARFSAGINGTGHTVIADDDAAILTAVFVEEGNILIADGTAGDLNLNGAAVQVDTATGTSLTVSEILADHGGGDGISKTRNGTLTLTGENTYTGATNIAAGSLVLGNNTSAGSLDTSGINVESAATFAINRGNAVSQSADITGGVISGDGDVAHIGIGTTTLDRANTYTGKTIIQNGTVEAGVDDVAGTGALGNGGDINFTGGELQYAAGVDQDYSSRIKDSTAAMIIDTNTNDVTYAAALVATNIGGLTKQGAGTLNLTAAGNAYGGNTVVNGGTLNIDAGASVTGTVDTAVNSGATLNVDGTLANLTTVNSGGTLTGAGTINGNLVVGSGGTFSAGGAARENFTVNGDVNLQTGSNAIFGLWIEDPADHDTLTLTGSGLFTANGTIDVDLLLTNPYVPQIGDIFDLVDFSSFTGTPSFDFSGAYLGPTLAWDTDFFAVDGTIRVVEARYSLWDSNNTGAGTDPSGTFSWDTTNWSKDVNGTDTTIVWDNFGGDGGIARFSAGTNGTGAITVNADQSGVVLTGIEVEEGNITIAADAGDLALNGEAQVIVAVGTSLLIEEPLTDNGVGDPDGINKTGAGTATLTGENTYTGGTTVSGGTLVLGHATNTLADGGEVTVNGGTLDLNTNSDTVGAVTMFSGAINGSGGATLTGTSYEVHSGSVSAILAGGAAVDLIKESTGTVILTAANTYSGTTYINAGELVVGDGGTTGALLNTDEITGPSPTPLIAGQASLSASHGSLVINQSDLVDQEVELGGALITGDIGVIQRGTGTTKLCLDNTYTGATTVEAGTLLVCGTHSGDASVYTVQGGATLVVDGQINSDVVNIEAGGILSGNGTVGNGDAVVTLLDDSYLSPGDGLGDIGTLTISGDLDLQNAYNDDMGYLLFDSGPGGIDRVDVSGTLNLGDTPQINFDDFDFNVLGPLPEGTYTLFSASSVIGSVQNTSLFPNIVGDLSKVGDLFTLLYSDGAGVYLTSTSNIFDLIPEPSRAVLIGFGALTMILRRQRSRRS
jgi:autotransporter-associated beta strand protein